VGNLAVRLVLILGLPFAVMALALPQLTTGVVTSMAEVSPTTLLLAAGFYALAHGLRAVRLAIVSASVLGTSLRTVAMVHFHTAPVVYLIPWKLGELYRYEELTAVSGAPSRSLAVLLVDRCFDAVVIATACIALMILPGSTGTGLWRLLAVALVASFVGVFAFVILPPAIRSGQKYIFLEKTSPRARATMRGLELIHDSLDAGARTLRGKVAILLSLSVTLWCFELLGVVVLIGGATMANAGTFLSTALSASLTGSAVAGGSSLLRIHSTIAIICLCLIWLANIAVYIPRRLGQQSSRSVARFPQPLSSRLNVRA